MYYNCIIAVFWFYQGSFPQPRPGHFNKRVPIGTTWGTDSALKNLKELQEDRK